ncbi:inhibited guanine nucleotide-exchange protein 1 [Seminavis robusta]|uniref:Inhibited guanine nucleotide-exchange protein 1 n=1 Tax=Seminavis robusta TaxID=568900 RepID=A0A9N8H504_9STRA|nr:inhibited guanine nucleotide-exchange protein 1 [Seminavis robusta]|eukprot:Sro63_g035620.1 inhibited guanine nucleotide-exchange protein 1 (2048) ;mRNA; f:6562-12855
MVEANGGVRMSETEEEATPKVNNTKVVDVSKAGPPLTADTTTDDAVDLVATSGGVPNGESSNGSKEKGSNKSTTASISTPGGTAARGVGMRIHVDTPIPNADRCLRILRKFLHKTRPKIAAEYGGTKSAGLMRFFRSSSVKEDPTFVPYGKLVKELLEGEEDNDEGDLTDTDEDNSEQNTNITDESDFVVDSILGASGDSMAKARASVAAFCHLLSVWSHASSRFFEQQDTKSQEAFSEILFAGIDTATELVSHGCLDGVEICNLASADDYHPCINIFAQSILVADVTLERSELAAMKFLLSAGCRVKPGEDALLRGTHLLQTIRMLYHIYLTTDCEANRTTARAALQQLVTSIFARLVRTQVNMDMSTSAPSTPASIRSEPSTPNTPNNGCNSNIFPSENHRDAFLVLRSICKLSMRNMPDPSMHSHIGLQTSGSNAMWDGDQDGTESDGVAGVAETPRPKEQPHLVFTGAIHPAMESKVLALELLHYVLENVKFTREFVLRSGPQFHSAIRNYLCVSLLKNCTSDNSRVVHLSLRMFALLVRNFRAILKNEVEAFVTNVFFVILDSKNSPIEHKSLVVTLFEEICSDPNTLAEIFLNYDCDLSAVDLFHRIVNTLSRVARSDAEEPKSGTTIGLVAGAGAARAEKMRNEHRELRLDAMRALRQVLASLHASIVEPMGNRNSANLEALSDAVDNFPPEEISSVASADNSVGSAPGTPTRASKNGESGKQSLVEIYDSKKKRRQEESEAVLRFNQKPAAGIKYAAECGHVDGDEPSDIARYLLVNKDKFEKTQIGEYLGREAEYQGGMALKVLNEYVRLMDFVGLQFDDAIRYYLSGFRLPGEAQKIDRIMEKFAERYTDQNQDIFPSADVAFILAFSIIMLNTDLHNPAIKEERRMTRDGFIRNNRGICDGQDLPDEFLYGIFDRIKANPISLKEDDEAREKAGDGKKAGTTNLPSALSPAIFFSSHYDDMDRTRETNFQKERDHIVRTTESLLKRRRHSAHHPAEKKSAASRSGHHGKRAHSKFVRTEDSGLRDEYVSPMFEVTWGPALAAFSTAMESANGTVGALENIATDEELELAAENAAETIEVCLTGFKLAICTAGLCGNEIARDAYMLALSRFSQLGTGVLLEPRHLRCIQTVLSLGRDDGELLGSTWEHVFKALAEINRFHQLFHLMARNDRAAAAAAARRRKRMEERAERQRERETQSVDSLDDMDSSTRSGSQWSQSGSLAEEDLFSDDEDLFFDDEMDGKAIDEANARVVYEAVSESMIQAIYERSSSLSTKGAKEFIFELCRVSRMEISVSGYGGHVGSDANTVDLTKVQYRQHHSLLSNNTNGDQQFHHSQPNIYSLQKLVEATHYNMDSRPRLFFSEIWTTVSGHLTSTALHSNPAVAMYAVDSFRQLSIQFLQRGETEGFENQKRFLKPLETVMSRSEHVSTKELLLKCVERIVFMFGCDDVESEVGGHRKGSLKSGWVAILRIIGIAGRDEDESVAKMGYDMLKEQLRKSVEIEQRGERAANPQSSSILAEHFVDAIDALFAYVGGVHEELSAAAIDELLSLCKYLGDEGMPLPPLRRKTSHLSVNGDGEPNGGKGGAKDFEHWWPILLGLSRSVDHPNVAVRSKALSGLLKITEQYFLARGGKGPAAEDRVQTLRLIFRGILTPVLEFAETSSNTKPPPLPDDFVRHLTGDKAGEPEQSSGGDVGEGGWLETTFDEFMDGCVSICLKSISVFEDDLLAEEIFAILNTCLLSDSGELAVRGLKRLEKFVAEELDSKYVTDNTWATVSHMLRRCLNLRGLPKLKDSTSRAGNGEERSELNAESEHTEDEDDIREFVMEDSLLPGRRYVGSNVVMVIGSFLMNERFVGEISMNWRLFLVTGLGRGIRDWEQAATVISRFGSKASETRPVPPDYRETAVYGRKWMSSIILSLAPTQSVAYTPAPSDPTASIVAEAQKVVKEQTQKLLSAFIAKENTASQKGASPDDTVLYEVSRDLVLEFLSGFGKMDSAILHHLDWLNPVLLSWCTRSKHKPIQQAVHDLLENTSPASPPKK